MNQNICNNCGGDFEYRGGRWICRSCGSYKPEELSNEEVTLLYTAFRKLRLAEFSEAELEFDDFIRKYPENPNGYWGRLMAKYGIKYEVDFDGRMIPTCYAASIESVQASPDFQKALQYADEENKAYYQRQAEYIERVRLEWIGKAKKEKPYDIFICYKDSDLANNIERTRDSIAAQDLYIHLTNKGYRVFYSHESLRDKVGEKYEPYIFNALATAKVMVVYGTNPDYITSTWLKNEWTRYEKRIQSGEKKPNSLIVACDGFSPNELPTALSSMQCLNAGAKSFYSDLDEAIEKIVYGETVAEKYEKRKKSKAPILISVFAILAVLIGFLSWRLISEMNACDHVAAIDPAVAASCTSSGLTEGAHCMLCNEILVKQEFIPITHTSVVEATCAEPKKCTACNAVLGDPLPHTPGAAATCTTAQTCTVCHAVVAPKAPHTPGAAATCTRTQNCTVCNAVISPLVPHTTDAIATCRSPQKCTVCKALVAPHTPSAAATCTTAQTCTVCDRELQSAFGHTPDEWQILKAATKTENGLRVRNCTVCHARLTEVIYATGSIGLSFSVNDDGSYSVSGIGNCTDTDVFIPAVYNGKPVTAIGNHAFFECSTITSVTIPESVTWIGVQVFRYCTNLQRVNIPTGVTRINGSTFNGCSNLTSITIPDGVTSIGAFAFDQCKRLTSIVIPDSVTSIGEYAFQSCSGLTSIVIPDSLTDIGNRAFTYCSKLTEIHYGGTKEQWQSISFAESWDDGTAVYTVYCTDGTISDGFIVNTPEIPPLTPELGGDM